MRDESLKALAADTCWGCGRRKKELHLTVLTNNRGEYDLRYDYLCTYCLMALSGVGAN